MIELDLKSGMCISNNEIIISEIEQEDINININSYPITNPILHKDANLKDKSLHVSNNIIQNTTIIQDMKFISFNSLKDGEIDKRTKGQTNLKGKNKKT